MIDTSQFPLPPGYIDFIQPPSVDLSRYPSGVVAAGRGPISGNPANSVAQMCSLYFGENVYTHVPLSQFTSPAFGHSRYGY